MSSAQLYDTIGATYAVTRRTEPRIAARVWAALGDARTVLNVGAGTGSYEPPDRDVTAVEPSAVMRAQRPAGAAPCVAAVAENLPFADQSFDAAMAFSTTHHWKDPIAGLREMRRVARRVVVFTFDASDAGWHRRFWLTRDYLPEVAGLLGGWPSLSELAGAIGARAEPVPVPWDCADGFFEAHWRRPEAYLDDRVRRGVSVWSRVGQQVEQRVVRELRDDLGSGRWAERNHDLAALDEAEARAPPARGLSRYAGIVTPEELVNLAHLRRARDLMDREYASPLDLAAVARVALMSTGHFSRQFRATYGETPYGYLMTRRIERAMALLRLGELTVTEVCMAVGCTSLGSFSARFTQLVGETPTAYRARDHGGLANVPGCVARNLTRPSRRPIRAGAAARGAGSLA